VGTIDRMLILRTVLWSVACVALGLALATVEIGGRTPWERVRGKAPRLESVKSDLEGAVATAKVKLAAPRSAQPVEAHTDSERDAVNALVSKRSVKK
jgi:hypothetical protein